MSRTKQFIGYLIQEIETSKFADYDGNMIKDTEDAKIFHWEDDAIDEIEEKYDVNKFRTHKVELTYRIDLEG